MRRAIRSVLQLQNNLRHSKVHRVSDCNVKRKLSYVTSVHSRKHLINVESGGISYVSYLKSRALLMDAVQDNCQETNGKIGGPLVEYERRIAAGKLTGGDERQLGTLSKLQRLYDELVESADACKLDRYATAGKVERSRWSWSRLMPQLSSVSPVQGLYLYGGVGTGKTMLMDLFYDQLPSNWRKKRIHFHDFMLNVQSRLQKHKGVSDPLEIVADEISEEAVLLCLDEFMVTDVAVALFIRSLFSHLFNNGVVLVATSNRAPDNLYERGTGLQLQMDIFRLFIATLKERCVIHPISSAVDYRKLTSAEQGFYFVGKDGADLLKKKFQCLIADHVPGPQVVEVVMGRKLQISLGANRCTYFSFEELCGRPLGAADYIGLFKSFHTLALEGVPIFDLYNKTSAYRFVTLVDVTYDNKARLLCSAERTPFDLFENIVTVSDAQNMAPMTSVRSRKNSDLDLCVDNELAFAKDRTISRLTEMNSKEYLEQHVELQAAK